VRKQTDPDQEALFAVEDTPVVKVPVRPRGGARAKVRWSKYVTKTGIKCDDCLLVLALNDGVGPATRQARWRRQEDAHDLLLCYAHAQQRRIEDGLGELE
jgi:hypothetical protein